jgi:hypothetical protein
MARHKSEKWELPEVTENWDQAMVAVLMDLRDQLDDVQSLLQEISVSTSEISNHTNHDLVTPKMEVEPPIPLWDENPKPKMPRTARKKKVRK